MAKITHLPYADTHHFSALVTSYLAGAPELQQLYAYTPDEAGIAAAIRARQAFRTDRGALTEVLQRQYRDLPGEAAVTANIARLSDERTFTVCTAHQPNLGTGYLYFVYKILHAIRLAASLSQQYPEYHFVPVYYIGSEDNDLDELGTFRYGGRKFTWDADGQTGAVGRMSTGSLKPLLGQLFALLGPPGPHLDELKALLSEAYLEHPTIAGATQYLVHRLFGRHGLVALDPDDAALKRAFIPVMEDDLLHHTANGIVTETVADLQQAGHKSQAFPRPVNLFYLRGNIRERIERQGAAWQVLGTDIRWDRESLLRELHAHPEHFSPNVILRGLYQETILPDIAFIGGGAEVAYWLQLRSLFRHYGVFYPAVLLRQSVLWVRGRAGSLRRRLGLDEAALFAPEATLIRQFVRAHAAHDCSTGLEQAAFGDLLTELKEKAVAISPTLKASTEAVLTKIRYQLQVLEKKMLRAEKRNMSVEVEQISRLKALLFPNGGLQERVENFMEYYLELGPAFFDTLLEAMQPLQAKFLIVEEEEELA